MAAVHIPLGFQTIHTAAFKAGVISRHFVADLNFLIVFFAESAVLALYVDFLALITVCISTSLHCHEFVLIMRKNVRFNNLDYLFIDSNLLGTSLKTNRTTKKSI